MATLPDGTQKRLIEIKDWNFNWQDVYRYAPPFFLPRGTTLSMRYTYDNSSANIQNPNQPPKRVVTGNRSSDEMAHLWIQILPETHNDRLELMESVLRRLLHKTPSNIPKQFRLGHVLRERGKFDEAIERFQYVAKSGTNDLTAKAYNAIGVILASRKDHDEADEELRST